ncbi:hypothetical protein GGQ20_000478 [Salinibacter ruber]|nr:hypothetical protein [Salinibacter ruber]
MLTWAHRGATLDHLTFHHSHVVSDVRTAEGACIPRCTRQKNYADNKYYSYV